MKSRSQVCGRRAVWLAWVLAVVSASAQADGPPFMRDLAAGHEQDLPVPYGLSVVYSDNKQNLNLDDLQVTANGNPTDAETLFHLGHSDIKSSTVLLKGDLWLLPFLDVFAFAGQASNDVSVDYSVNGSDAIAAAGSSACDDPSDPNRPAACDRTFSGTLKRSNDAADYGGGASFAAASGPAFALLSLIYSYSDSSGTKVKAFTGAPRFGWRFATQTGDVSPYVGASYVDTKVDVHGQTTVATDARSGSNAPSEIVFDYSVDQKSQAHWSYMGGVNWDITRHWALQGEYAGGARQGLLTSLTWRFGG